MRALVFSSLLVQIDMLLQIRTLRKLFRTAVICTFKRFFLGVNSQMVKEIASLSEVLATVWEGALHDSPDPLRFCMLELQNSKVAGVRDVSALADVVEGYIFLLAVFFGYYLGIVLGGLALLPRTSTKALVVIIIRNLVLLTNC